jgi:putative ABC transport system permease protein
MTRLGDAVYRLMLRLFPVTFRRRHGSDMIRQFIEQRRAVRGHPLQAPVLWARAISDVLRHGLALRAAELKLHRPAGLALPNIRWICSHSTPREIEVRQALRSLHRSPWCSLTVVAVIGLSTALCATVFAIVDGVLFKPLPFPNPENLSVVSSRRAGRSGGVFKMDEIAPWRDAIPGLQAAAMQLRWNAGTIGDGRSYGAVAVDEHFFDVLGQRPAVGGFAPEHFRAGSPPVAIISHRLWRRVFAGRHDALGKVLPLVGGVERLGRPATPATVVGILPRDFVFPAFSNEIPDVIRPLVLSSTARAGRNESAVLALIRRPAGLPIEQLQQRLDAAVRAAQPAAEAADPILDGASLRAIAEVASPFAKDFRTLALVAGFLLALACVGVGGLSSARSRQRERDVVLRRALGATTWDLFRQTSIEVAPPIVAGSVFGFFTAPILLEFTLSLLPLQTAFVKPPEIDPRVAALTIALAASTTLIVALGVLTTARRVRLIAPGSINATGRFRRFSQAVVAAQAGLAFALTLGGTLVVTSLWHVWQIDPGYDSERIAVIEVTARTADSRTVAEDAIHANEALARLPGVEAAGVFGFRLLQHGYLVATARPHPGAKPVEFQQIPHGGDLIGVLKLTPVRGRLPTRAEFARGDPVVLVSERAAAAFWPGEDPIGRPLLLEPHTATVIGVVRDLQFTALDASPRAAGQIHTPNLGFREISFLLRTNGQPESLVTAARAQLAARREQFDVVWAGTMEEALAGSIAQRRFAAWAYGGFAIAALAITSVGIIGLVAMVTSLRTREMAVRLALGAGDGRVIRLLLKEQLSAVAMGLVAGGILAAWSVRTLSRQMYGVTTTDPIMWAVTAVIILVMASIGTLLPARRAARTDPIQALRAD